jgi:two-component system, OmpR family, sensor histidine kinase MprB
MSFRRRLVWLIVAAVGGAVAVSALLLFVIVRGELRAQLDDELRGFARGVVALPASAPARSPAQQRPQARGALPPNYPTGLVLRLPREPLEGPIGYAQLVRPDGLVVRPPIASVSLPVDNDVTDVARGRRAPFFRDMTLDGERVRVLTTHAADGDGAVQAAKPLRRLERTLSRLAWALTAIALGGIAAAWLIGLALTRTALRPVARLSAVAEHIAGTGDLSTRLAVRGDDEVARFAANFNVMLDELERSLQARRQIVADASHELRTPVAVLRTNIELLEERDGLPPDERARLRATVTGQLDRLGALIGDIITLARAGETTGPLAEVRLDVLVEDAAERIAAATSAEIDVDAEPCEVVGDAERLHRAITNLLDNAVKWSPPGEVVEVRVRHGEITVRDHGPGIAPDQLPKVFDRFYRAPEARRLPGSGLGLAIVRQVAEHHGGTVEVTAAPGGGALFTLRLPVAPAVPAATT